MLKQRTSEYARFYLEKTQQIIRACLIWVISLYRLFVSPILGNHCRFMPSCSEYAQEAIKEKGVFKGLYLTIYRLLRCHPWGGSGFDPVNKKQRSQ